MNWYVGDIWKVKAKITSPATGEPVDPSSVVITITKPSGATETPSVTRDGVGEDHCEAELTEDGFWKAVVSTTGTYKGVARKQIRVRKP